MKIRWWILILLIIGLVAGPIIKNIPGFVVIAYQQTTVQFPLWLGVFLAILALILSSIFIVILMKIFAVTGKAKNWSGSRKWKSARKDTIDAMLLFAEGNWYQSEKKMIKASKNGDTKLINFLIAAQAAQKQTEYARRDEYLKRAKNAAPTADTAIGLTQARLQMESGQNEQALATLTMLLESNPKNKYLNELFIEVNMKLESWQQVIDKTPQLEKDKVYSSEKLLQVKRQSIVGMLKKYFKENNQEKIKLVWDGLSRGLKKDPVIMQNYAEILVLQKNHSEAENLLKKLLKSQPTNEAIKLYSELKTEKPGKQLDFLESIEHHNIKQSDYYIALANLASSAELWGKSRDYLQKSLTIEDTVKTRAKLANTLVKLGEHQQAQDQRQKAVKLLEGSPPEK